MEKVIIIGRATRRPRIVSVVERKGHSNYRIANNAESLRLIDTTRTGIQGTTIGAIYPCFAEGVTWPTTEGLMRSRRLPSEVRSQELSLRRFALFAEEKQNQPEKEGAEGALIILEPMEQRDQVTPRGESE